MGNGEKDRGLRLEAEDLNLDIENWREKIQYFESKLIISD